LFLASSAIFAYTTLFRSSGVAGEDRRGEDVGGLVGHRDDVGLHDGLAELALGVLDGVEDVEGLAGRAGELDVGGLERPVAGQFRSEEHTSELQSRENLVC